MHEIPVDRGHMIRMYSRVIEPYTAQFSSVGHIACDLVGMNMLSGEWDFDVHRHILYELRTSGSTATPLLPEETAKSSKQNKGQPRTVFVLVKRRRIQFNAFVVSDDWK